MSDSGINPTNTIVNMEMVVGSVEKNDDGSTKVNYLVKFSNGENHILFPWEGLKNTVLQWMKIEGGGVMNE